METSVGLPVLLRPWHTRLLPSGRGEAVIGVWGDHIFCTRPNTELKPGQKGQYVFPEYSDLGKVHEYGRIGLRDTFGRTHWLGRKYLKRIMKNAEVSK